MKARAKDRPVVAPAGGWTTTSYNTQTNGECAVTKHPVVGGGWFYIAWDRQDQLGTFDSADEAKSAALIAFALRMEKGRKVK